jgi:hypothetical protein
VLVAAAIVFVVAQSVVNDDVHRKFGADLRANRDLLASFTDEPPPEQRCATLEAWASLPYWQAYYREALVDGINTTYAHFHDEPSALASVPRPRADAVVPTRGDDGTRRTTKCFWARSVSAYATDRARKPI